MVNGSSENGLMTNQSLISVATLSVWLDVPISTIYRWRYEGVGPPSYRVGRHVKFSPAEIEEWLAARSESPKAGGVAK